jgi:hypothetical protein
LTEKSDSSRRGRALRKVCSVLLAALVGLIGTVLFGGPAHATVAHSYYGERGHVWSNSAGDRIGIEDLRRDGIRIYAFISLECAKEDVCGNDYRRIYRFDLNNSEPGRRLYLVPDAYRVVALAACGVPSGQDPAPSIYNCGALVTP